MQTFMAQVNQQGQASSGLKETVDLYKSRSKLSLMKAMFETKSNPFVQSMSSKPLGMS
jgi:hypothetical protein